MKYTLTAEMPRYDQFTGRNLNEISYKNTVEFDEDSIDEVLENIELFLRGCGFADYGRLQFVPQIQTGCGGSCQGCDCK
jgi:hypothetical protein